MVDPAANLLAWSEDFSKAVWVKDPLLGLSAGEADPLGTARATRLINTGQSPQGIAQTVTAPGWYRYAWSGWFRSAGSGSGRLRVRAGAAAGETAVAAGAAWSRFYWSGQLAAGAEQVEARFELDAGAAVTVFGLQLEAQPSPSGYNRTGAQGGVYPHARFAADELWEVAEGAGRSGSRIRVVSKLEG